MKKYCKLVLNSTKVEADSVLGGGVYEELFIYTSVVVIIICGIVFNICDSWVEGNCTPIYKFIQGLLHWVIQMVRVNLLEDVGVCSFYQYTACTTL
mgnify:CR=1 FL=1